MKHKQKMTALLMAAALAAAIAIPALAANILTIDVEPGVTVYVNDMPIDAGDTHGNPEAFIYNGTTYIAAAAVSKSLGENVKWDGKSRSVYIGKHIGSSSYLLNVCPPYETTSIDTSATFTMAGKKYANGLMLYGGEDYDPSFALFNLNGKYDKLKFTAGHVDGRDMWDGQYNIYLDGELVFSLDMDPQAMPKEYTVPLNGALQMKIEAIGFRWGYALTNIQVS